MRERERNRKRGKRMKERELKLNDLNDRKRNNREEKN